MTYYISSVENLNCCLNYLIILHQYNCISFPKIFPLPSNVTKIIYNENGLPKKFLCLSFGFALLQSTRVNNHKTSLFKTRKWRKNWNKKTDQAKLSAVHHWIYAQRSTNAGSSAQVRSHTMTSARSHNHLLMRFEYHSLITLQCMINERCNTLHFIKKSNK